MYSRKKIEQTTRNLLRSFNVSEPGYDIESLVKRMGVEIEDEDLGEGISGMLYVRNGNGVIGLNNLVGPRRRFTVAHELGHYVLHRLNKNLFIDDQKTFFRKSQISPDDRIIEREANAFAAAILMPEALLEREINDNELFWDLMGYSSNEENCINDLAETFKVSKTAMTFRISNLNLLSEF